MKAINSPPLAVKRTSPKADPNIQTFKPDLSGRGRNVNGTPGLFPTRRFATESDARSRLEAARAASSRLRLHDDLMRSRAPVGRFDSSKLVTSKEPETPGKGVVGRVQTSGEAAERPRTDLNPQPRRKTVEEERAEAAQREAEAEAIAKAISKHSGKMLGFLDLIHEMFNVEPNPH